MLRIALKYGMGAALLLSTSAARAQSTAPPPLVPPPPPPVIVAPQPSQWHPGDPAPPGYHVEELPRSGLVVAGAIVFAVPYFFSAVSALSANSQNESGWLYVPVAGPWMTLGRRTYSCNPDNNNQSTSQSLGCVADVFVVMGLIFDGIVQATGASLILAGELATKPGLVRNDEALRVVPMRLGSGMGAGVVGGF
jgi:hypothetical protein